MKALATKEREEIKKLAANYGAHNVRLFGSVARREARSDVRNASFTNRRLG